MTKFKVGDTVRVKSIEWYNENKDGFGCINQSPSTLCFNSFMSTICGLEIKITQIDHRDGSFQNIGILGGIWLTDWMVENEAVKSSKSTASLSPPFNYPIDPSLTSQAATSISHSSALPFNATKAIKPLSSKTIYPTEEHIYEAVDKADFLDWQQYRFDLIKAVLPALVQGDNSAENCAKKSIEIADEVIKLLKDEKNI